MTFKFAGNDAPELQVTRQFTGFRAVCSIPGCFVRVIGAITIQTAIAVDLPANRRGRAIQLTGNGTQG